MIIHSLQFFSQCIGAISFLITFFKTNQQILISCTLWNVPWVNGMFNFKDQLTVTTYRRQLSISCNTVKKELSYCSQLCTYSILTSIDYDISALMKQKLLTLVKLLSSPLVLAQWGSSCPIFRLLRSVVSIGVCPFSFGHCIVCPFSIGGL